MAAPLLRPASLYPTALFAEWLESAKAAGVKDATAVFLATATPEGAPSCRVVLLKGFDENGFVIYTNLQSRKSQEITRNPRVALCFYWAAAGRQVRIEGIARKVSAEEADAYFATRPLKSRIGAWASRQSEPLASKSELLRRVAFYTAKWAIGETPRPPHWSGFRIVPDYFEFWQDIPAQAPERLVFRALGGEWQNAYLYP